MDPMPRLRVLGGFELLVGTQPVPLPRNAQRLLGFVAVRRSNVLRGTVAGNLWPNSTQTRAQASLRTALWRLHQGHPRLVVSNQRAIRIHDQLYIDLQAATALARQVLKDDYDPAVALFGVLSDDLLPDWDEDWVFLERERVREMRIHALESLSRHFTRTRNFAAAIDAAYVAIAGEPLRESSRAALIEAHLAEGNRALAARDLAEYRILLGNELGLEPSPKLCARLNPQARND
ncbi:MAG: AfsR/SARP family transcriptional regulator [Pseudonocardiaceae bacterium]